MATILTLPHALILSCISAIFFAGGFVFMSKSTSTSLKELQISVKENDTKTNDKLDSTNHKLDSVAFTLNTIQLEQKHQSEISKRDIDSLSYRITALENREKNHASIN